MWSQNQLQCSLEGATRPEKPELDLWPIQQYSKGGAIYAGSAELKIYNITFESSALPTPCCLLKFPKGDGGAIYVDST
jgi:hypothetical protein